MSSTRRARKHATAPITATTARGSTLITIRRLSKTLAPAATALAVGVLAGLPAVAAADSCPNAAIRAEQHSGALPDCRALELLSPPAKGGSAATPIAMSDDGHTSLFSSSGIFAGTQTAGPINFYVTRRGSSGWATDTVNPASSPFPLRSDATAIPLMPPDLSRVVGIGFTESGFSDGIGAFYSTTPGGATADIGALHPVVPSSSPNLLPRAGTADLTHVVFTSETDQHMQIVGGEPVVQQPGAYNLWEAVGLGTGTSSYRFIPVDNDGNAIGGTCGATLGGLSGDIYQGSTGQHAVSQDGRVIYFAARPEVAGSCVVPKRVYARIDGTQTVPVSASECDRVSPACDSTDGDDVYEGASTDGSRVFFLSPRQLADSDTDVGGQDLYSYDSSLPSGQRVVQVSRGDGQGGAIDGDGAGVEGVVRISDDGSRAYFVATGVLTTTPNGNGAVASDGDHNLYVFERNAAHPNGRVAFIAALDSRDNDPNMASSDYPESPSLWGQAETGGFGHRAYAVPRYGAGGSTTGGDGHVLVFQSYGQLAADDHDDSTDIYRYDDSDGTLARVSTAVAGAGSEAGDGAMNAILTLPSVLATALPQATQAGRSVSEDGQSVLFSTAEALEQRDDNGVTDAYLWRSGEVARVSVGTHDAGVYLNTPMLTPSGRDVTFQTVDHLLPEDVDTTGDIYDARVDGGFPAAPAPPAPCTDDGCQGPATNPPTLPLVGSVTFAGPGNEVALAPLPPVVPSPAGKVTASGRKVVKGSAGIVKVKVPGQGRLTTSGSGLASTTRSLTKAGTYTVTVRLSKRATATLKRKHRFVATVRVAFTPKVGKASTVRLRLTFTQPSAKKTRSAGRAASTSDGTGR